MKPEREWRLLHWRALAALRPAEVAAVTGLSERKVGRLVEAGELRSRRVDGCVLVPVDEVRRLVGELEDAGAAPSAPTRPTVRRRALAIVARMGG